MSNGALFCPIFFTLTCGIRQGGVLSPHLFAIYIDDVVGRIELSNIGCCIKLKFVSTLLYADDIILISPSVVSLQKLLFVCELELNPVNTGTFAERSNLVDLR